MLGNGNWYSIRCCLRHDRFDTLVGFTIVAVTASNCFRCYQLDLQSVSVLPIQSVLSILHRLLWGIVVVVYWLDPVWYSTRCFSRLKASILGFFLFFSNSYRSTSQYSSFRCSDSLVDTGPFNSVDPISLVNRSLQLDRCNSSRVDEASCWWGILFFYQLKTLLSFLLPLIQLFRFVVLALVITLASYLYSCCSCRRRYSSLVVVFLYYHSCHCWHTRRLLVSRRAWY